MGAFIVLSAEGNALHTNIPFMDYILVLQQWEVPQPRLGKVYPGTYDPNKFDRNPNFFTIKGCEGRM